MKYYTLDRIKSKHCNYNFIYSGRGPGKSTAVVNELSEAFAQRGAEFVRLVRYDFEISRTNMTLWFNDVNRRHLQEIYGKSDVKYHNNTFRVYDEDEPNGPGDVMGYVVPLNAQDAFKSVSYDRVENVVFEEFIQMRERDYVDGEIQLFLSALSTIVRHRDNVTVWFIGNTISKHNPYFEYFGIDLDALDMHPGDLRTFRCSGFDGQGATIAIEYAEMAEEGIEEIAPLMRVSRNVIATTGDFAAHPGVAAYEGVKALGLPTSPVMSALPFCHVGSGVFARVEYTTRPLEDGRRYVVISPADVREVVARDVPVLQLAEDVPQVVTPTGRPVPLRLIDADAVRYPRDVFRRLAEADHACGHAYFSDNARFRWESFIEGGLKWLS